MRYDRSAAFKSDYRRLTEDEKDLFREAVRRFNTALDDIHAKRATGFPAVLRIKRVEGTTGVFEMTWNFTDPDGRATWEYIKIDGQPAIRWRRVGDHSIFKRP